MSHRLSRSKKRKGIQLYHKNRKGCRHDEDDDEGEEVIIEDSISNMEVDILPVRNLSEISAGDDVNWIEWIPAKETLNSFAKDWLLDWLKYHHPDSEKYINYGGKRKAATSQLPRNNSRGKKKGLFIEYILEQGNVFENKVLELLKAKYSPENIIHIRGDRSARSRKHVLATYNAMMQGIPIIHSGVLHNPENKTYGIPDLIVRSDWVNKLFLYHAIPVNDQKIPALRLREIEGDKLPPYHYVIIDIKFSKLHLRADGIHLLNSGLMPAYKSQLLTYTRALARIQGYNPQKAYILGRNWEYTTKGIKYTGKGCLEKLGVINYTKTDKLVPKQTDEALEWIRLVRSQEAREWNVYKSKDYRLRPNMCNRYDSGWRNIKKEIAQKTNELTDVWMIGVKNRKKAFDNNVYSWKNRKCNSSILGINGKKTGPLVDAILKVNRLSNNSSCKILPEIIENDYMGWQSQDVIEFYVDFETVNDISANFWNDGETIGTELIFMIGVGYVDPFSGNWKYTSFIAKSLSLDEELRICKQFCRFIKLNAIYYGGWDVKCVHWAPAERVMWDRAIERHSFASSLLQEWDSSRGEWFDLLQVFKSEPITVKGSLNFGLKSIAKAMYSHGFIHTEWNSASGCLDGRDAMIGAWNANSRGGDMSTSPEMFEIREYNEVDVKVLYEIITYLRKNHIKVEDIER